MFLAAQYYRPPFPVKKYWPDDFSRMRDSGLHAVQLWVIWGWVESQPGAFNFQDYDELVGLAGRKGLKVVLSTIAEIHPFWIHRLVPGSEMIDCKGHLVISSLRREANVGLTPGGCFDNPKVAELMSGFISATAARYAAASHLLGWDCWNETRWCVNCHDYVCYCPHTLREFRAWLDRRHGGLEGVSRAWQRRYCSWDDVFPGRVINHPYTEMMEFTRFLVDRATKHIKMRYDAIRSRDKTHLISAHCGGPSIDSAGGNEEQALCRGNDWDLADQLDGYGCSHFPFWGEGFDDAGFGTRVECTRSANRGKVVWVSELQGGTARGGIFAFRSVTANPQQRWVANGMARGAKGVIFWCWRDEVFGAESSGFGLSGWDGLAKDRLAAMKKTGAFIGKHKEIIDAYQPDPARVGVLFVPDNYLLKFADRGPAPDAAEAVKGCSLALERLGMPYEFVEARHLDVLKKLDVLLMPWPLIVPDTTAKAILKFIKRGGRVLLEGEADAFDELGFYRYPDERPFMRALGLHDLGRRQLADNESISVDIGDEQICLPLDNFITPLSVPSGSRVLARSSAGQPLMVRKSVGRGAAYVLGGFAARPYFRQRNSDFERLVRCICDDAGVKLAVDLACDDGDLSGQVQWRAGKSGRRRMLWLINSGHERAVTITDKAGLLKSRKAVRELVGGRDLPVIGSPQGRQVSVKLPAELFSVLVW
ncbi:MAG: beta-galactosidase [Planctomycetes bacterium]|nr:beta-galactosidase [Planctomycetota bacterium]